MFKFLNLLATLADFRWAIMKRLGAKLYKRCEIAMKIDYNSIVVAINSRLQEVCKTAIFRVVPHNKQK